MTEEPANTAGSFFGRRKGKSLRPGHERLVAELLPRLRVTEPPACLAGRSARADFGALSVSSWEHRPPVDLPGLFGPGIETVRLEIGFGGGEHLAAAARAEPGIGFIGCEPFVNGVAKLLAVVEAEDLANIRLWDRDAAELIARLPDASLDRVHLLFPDPWPKRRQRKRRFVSDENLDALARVMRAGAELRFATDIDDYAGWALARILRSPHFDWPARAASDWRDPWPGWPGTRYEAKAKREGRPSSYLTFVRSRAAWTPRREGPDGP